MADTISASPRIWSEIFSALKVAMLEFSPGLRVTTWLIRAITISTAPPVTARYPSQGWNNAIPTRNTGVHGMSKNAISTGEAILEMAGSFSNHRIDLDKRLVIKGMEHIEQARADGKGVLLLGMHFNSIDVGSRLLGYLMDFYAVYRPNDNRVIDRLINQGRGNYLKGNVPRSDIRQMIRLLRNGEVLWYAPDQDYGIAHAVFVPFFGIPAATITATSRIARMGKARVIPTAHYRLPGGRYQIEFGPPLENFPSGDPLLDATSMNRVIEVFVRDMPDQYFWAHRRFKTQPPGSPDYYAQPPVAS